MITLVSTPTGPAPDQSTAPQSGDQSGEQPHQAGQSIGPGGLTDEQVAAEEKAMLETIGRAWWLVLALGAVSLVAGICIMAFPFTAVKVAAVIFGLWLLISGIFQLARSFDSRLDTLNRVMSAISGVIGIVLGIICFNSVANRIELLVLFIGLWWVIRGLTQLMAGAGGGGRPANGFVIFLGVLGIIAGIVVLVWPIGSLSVLVYLTGIWLCVLGIFEIIASFRVKSLNAKQDIAA